MKPRPGIRCKTSLSEPNRAADSYDVAFIAPSSIDDRGKAAAEYCRSIATSVHELKFDIAARNFTLDGRPVSQAQLNAKLLQRKCLVEATALGVAEICRVLQSAVTRGVSSLDLLYVEPQDYARNDFQGIVSRSFRLSENHTFVGIPGFAIDTSQYPGGNAVFFLGFEGERLSQALEQMELEGWTKFAVFGVPAFQAAWETNAFTNNVAFLKNYGFQKPLYAAASSVESAYSVLEEIHGENNNTDNPTIIAPLGTKPHSIGCALFVAMNNSSFNSVGLIFDHPVKMAKRSGGTSAWHLITVTFP